MLKGLLCCVFSLHMAKLRFILGNIFAPYCDYEDILEHKLLYLNIESEIAPLHCILWPKLPHLLFPKDILHSNCSDYLLFLVVFSGLSNNNWVILDLTYN